MDYSTTFGTRKKWSSVCGALRTMASAISPAVTMSARSFIAIGVTEVIGSTPATSTSSSCSTKARMALISPRRCATSSSATAMRARCAMRRTVKASTDMNGHKQIRPAYSRGPFGLAMRALRRHAAHEGLHLVGEPGGQLRGRQFPAQTCAQPGPHAREIARALLPRLGPERRERAAGERKGRSDRADGAEFAHDAVDEAACGTSRHDIGDDHVMFVCVVFLCLVCLCFFLFWFVL